MPATLVSGAAGDREGMGMSEQARRQVKLWLCDATTVEPRDLVWRPVAADVVAAVALDRHSDVDLVTGTQAAAWDMTPDELFALGRDNLAAGPVPAADRLDEEVTVYRGDSDFVASWVLLLDALVAEPSEHGAVVAVPNRHTLLVHAIRDLGVVEAFVPMLQAAQLLWERDRDAVSNQLFWCRDGTLQRIPVPGLGNGHGGGTPRDFRRLLLRLPPRGRGRD